MLKSLGPVGRKTKIVKVPELGDIEVRELSISDSIRLQGLLVKLGDKITFGQVVVISLMCSMGDGEGGYLVPEDDRLEELLNLPAAQVNPLYEAYLALNPRKEAGALEQKKT